jgi:PRTRC genetic system protein B
MHLHAEYGQEAPLNLIHAILLYGSKDRIRLATLHTPEKDLNGGPPMLGEGQPISREFLQKLSRDLQGEMPAAWLPDNVIVWSQSLVAWWESARTRPMFFTPKSDGKSLDGKLYPHPPLLFAVSHMHLWVWALAENTRPAPQSPLFVAPNWNTSENGSVCHGSMAAPRRIESGNLPQWSEAYFGSRFTHSNLDRDLCRHPEGFLGMWRDLAGQSRFPVQYLIPKGTLRETLCRNYPSIA